MRFCIRLSAILAVLILLCITGLHCEAAYDSPEDTLKEAAGALDLPSDVQTEFDRIGISADDPASLLSLTPDELLHTVLRYAVQELSAPLRLCGILLTLTVLASLLGCLGDAAAEGSLRSCFDLLCTLCCIGTAAGPLCDCLSRTAAALSKGQVFITGYIPVFGAFIAAGGHPASGAAYQAFVLFLTNCFMQLLNAVLYPLLQMSASIGIADAVNPELHLSGISDGLQKAVTRILGFVMALYSAMLSMRGIVASAADTLASKSVKLLASGLIPIVGNAVSDAYGTVQGSIRLLRNGVGAAGILVVLLLTLPPLLSLICYRAVFRINGIFAEIAGNSAMLRLYANMHAVLSAAFAMLVCFSVMMVISSAVTLLLLGE